MNAEGITDDSGKFEYITLNPKIKVWDLTRIKEHLSHLLMNMKCDEHDCGKPAVAMLRITQDEKELKCNDHLITVTQRGKYKELKSHWFEIESELDELQKDVYQAHILLSTVESKYFKDKLKAEVKTRLDKIKVQITRILEDFERRTLAIKRHSNFDVFTFVHRETTTIYKDVSTVQNMIGPFIANIYAAGIYEQIKNAPTMEEIAKIEAEEAKAEGEEEEKTPKGEEDEEDELDAYQSHRRYSRRAVYHKSPGTLGATVDYTIDDHDEPEEEPKKSVSKTQKVTKPTDPSEKSYEIVSIFAALKHDFKTNLKYAQSHIDFLHRIRDRYADTREEIDNYINKCKLEPSEKFKRNRVIPNTQEIEDLLKLLKLDKEARIKDNYELKLDIKQNKKACQKFFEEVSEYQMPKIHQLKITNVNKVDTNMMIPFNKFLSHTMASHLQELFIEANKETNLAIYNAGLSKLLHKVQGTVSFKNILFNDDDLKNIFENIPEAKMIDFTDCNMFCISERFSINPLSTFELVKFKFTYSTKKNILALINNFFKYLAETMKNTTLFQKLKFVEVNDQVLNQATISDIFKSRGFKLSKQENQKLDDIIIF